MISKGYFLYADKLSSDFDIYTAGSGTFEAPAKQVNTFSVAGRNGLLTQDTGSFDNVEVVFTCVIKADKNYNLQEKASAIKAWLLSQVGYKRLEDSFNPEFYRKAVVSGSISWKIGELLRYGYTDINFNCMPQKWLKSGEKAESFSDSGTIENPTLFDSDPLIKVYGNGSGTITIGNQIISISNIDEYVVIDSDIMDCYKVTANKNNTVSLGSSGFPKLRPGETGISFSGGVTKVEITGRWWTI